MGCWRRGQRAQGIVNEVDFEHGQCKLLSRGAGGGCWHPRAVIPNRGSAPLCPQRCVLLPGACLGASGPCLSLGCSVWAYEQWGAGDLPTWSSGFVFQLSYYYCWIFFSSNVINHEWSQGGYGSGWWGCLTLDITKLGWVVPRQGQISGRQGFWGAGVCVWEGLVEVPTPLLLPTYSQPHLLVLSTHHQDSSPA